MSEELNTLDTPVLRMKGADLPSRAPRVLFSLNTPEDIQNFATGCDSDIGGTSTVRLDVARSQHTHNSEPLVTAKFWGDMSLRVKPGLEGKLRGGYAGIKTKVCVVDAISRRKRNNLIGSTDTVWRVDRGRFEP